MEIEQVDNLSIIELREELHARHLEVTGMKPVLIARLREALKEEEGQHETDNVDFSPPKKENDPTKLFIGQVPQQTTKDQLMKIFSPYGEIKNINFLKDRITGAHRGCAFLTYTMKESAEMAIENVKVTLPGARRSMILSIAGAKSVEVKKEWKLYVGMLSRSTTEGEIRRIFEPYGEIIEFHLITNPNGTSKGSAFIKYGTREEAQRAINAVHEKMKDKDAPGFVQCRFAHTKAEKLASQRRFMGMTNIGKYGHGTQITGQYGMGQGQFNPYGQQFGLHGLPGATKEHIVKGPPGADLFVLGLPDSYTDSDLGSLFSNFGTVISSKIQVDLKTGRSKGFGFVSFDNAEAARVAINAMDGFLIGSKRLNVRVKRGELSFGSGGFHSGGYPSRPGPY